MVCATFHRGDLKLQSFGQGKLDDVSAESANGPPAACLDRQRLVTEVS